MTPPKIAVVIPFFQRRVGILARSIMSVARQQGIALPLVVVVDDGSPVPAQQELAAVPDDVRARVKVLRQTNAGPSAARNAGLDQLADDVDYVAFLDSDDRWLPYHLSHAVRTLEQGYDVYFSNFIDLGETRDAFDVCGLDLESHVPLTDLPHAYAFQGEIVDYLLGYYPLETSTVVYRFGTLADLRFNPGFRCAYEDHLMWLAMATRTKRFAFSAHVEVLYGEGINIFRSERDWWEEHNWSNDQRYGILVDAVRFHAQVLRTVELAPQRRELTRRRLRELRWAFACAAVHRLRHRRPLKWHHLSQQVRADPLSAVILPMMGASVVAKWAYRRACRSTGGVRAP